MIKSSLPDGDYLIRVIVTDVKKGEHPMFVRCTIEGGKIPTEEATIKYLAKIENYSEGTSYQVKGISGMIDCDYDRFTDIMKWECLNNDD